MNFHGWFRPKNRGVHEKSLILLPIEIKETESVCVKRKRIVISVPKSCGMAIKRNRLRRILRDYLEDLLKDLPERNGLWIRIKGRYSLKNKEQLENWKKMIDRAYLKLQF